MAKSLFLLIFPMVLAQQPAIPPVPGNLDIKKEEEKIEISEIQNFLAPFVYDKDRFRDPFETQGGGAPLNPGEVYGPFLPLQTYRLNDFRLKGLLWKVKRPIAVFEAPNGKEYRLTIKDYIGENFGYIATIREKEVVIIQTIEEDNQRYSTTKVLFLDKRLK